MGRAERPAAGLAGSPLGSNCKADANERQADELPQPPDPIGSATPRPLVARSTRQRLVPGLDRQHRYLLLASVGVIR
jgi:hypothetical protein